MCFIRMFNPAQITINYGVVWGFAVSILNSIRIFFCRNLMNCGGKYYTCKKNELFLYLMKNLEVLIDVCAAHATISLWRRASNTVEISGSEECGRKVYWSTAAMQFDEVHIRVQTQWDSAFILLWMWHKTVESLQLYRRSVLLQALNDNKLFHHPRWVVTIYPSSLRIKAFVTML